MRISWSRAVRSACGTRARIASPSTPMCSTRTGCVRRSRLEFSKSRKAISRASKKLRRPVKWTCERSEAIQADEHARDNVSNAELALGKDGEFLGLRVRTLANVGAYISSERNLLATFGNVGTLTGTYDIRAAHVEVLAVMANTNGTAPYRGAGRPEATYVIERLIDDAARELGFDPVELRTKNLIPASAMPYKTALNLNYDCGDFFANQQKALAQADWAG